MFRFESPQILHLLWLIPVLLILNWLFKKLSGRKVQKAIGEKLYPFLSSSVSYKKRSFKTFLQILVFTFFVIAMARPQMGQSKQEIKSEGVELMLLVDVSNSMMAEDVRPNRLEQVKAELSKMLDLMPGNKIGVIAFAGSAVLLSPLSTDPSALRMYIDSLAPTAVSTQGTEFIPAFKEAEEAFNRGGVGKDDTVKVTRVILVASDGENHEKGDLEEAQRLAKEGIRIFTLAYGTEKGAPIPERDGMGFLRGYKKESGGGTVLSTVKGDSLKAIAAAGQGSFYHATFGGTHIRKVVEDIDKLEKTQFESEIATQYDEKFQMFVMTGIILALLELLLGERRSQFRLWKGRFEVPPA